jgi:CBS domain-containing protein
MSIKFLMNTNLHLVKSNVSIKEAVKKMNELNIGVILVGTEKKLEGIFSERDLNTKIIAKSLNIEKTKLKDVMTKDLITVKEDCDTEYAMSLMAKRNIRHLPVLSEDGKCVGMLSSRDLIRDMIDILENENNNLLEYILAVEKIKDIILKHKKKMAI